MSDQGWIPYELRDADQRRHTDEFHESIGEFPLAIGASDIPELVYLPAIEKKVCGKYLPRVWQTTGSCVGSAANRAYQFSQVGDIYVRQDSEEPTVLFPFAAYGFGRRKAGFRTTGDGSYGAAQAYAAEHFGTIALDNKNLNLPQPRLRDGWMKWPSSVERQWSHPKAWPIPESEVAAEANQHKIRDVKRIKSIDQLLACYASGYGVTIAGSFGSRNMRVRDGLLVADWNASWAHQMTGEGYVYWRNGAPNKSGELFFFDGNQWGPTAHPECPFQTGQHGVRGNFATTEKTMQKRIDRGEVYAHSDTEGFPPRKIDWESFVWKIDFGTNEEMIA